MPEAPERLHRRAINEDWLMMHKQPKNYKMYVASVATPKCGRVGLYTSISDPNYSFVEAVKQLISQTVVGHLSDSGERKQFRGTRFNMASVASMRPPEKLFRIKRT
eukprot:2657228-Amphidinium_carterae.1